MSEQSILAGAGRIVLREFSAWSFDEGGEEDFAALWLARAAIGNKAPFGPVLGYGQEIDEEAYVAVFSVRMLPASAKGQYDRQLAPVLRVKNKRPYSAMLTWGYRGAYSDMFGGCFTSLAFAEIPQPVQKRFRALLGPQYPHRKLT